MTPNNLRAARKSLGLSQTRMAAALEIGRRTYQRLEAGDAQIRKGTWLMVEDLLKENGDERWPSLVTCRKVSC